MRRVATGLLVVVSGMAAPGVSAAQYVSASEREALVRLRVDRGGRAEEVEALIRQADEAGAKGLPVTPLTIKIREGLSKGAAPARIEAVIRQMAQHLETADGLIRALQPALPAAEREAPVTLLGDALGGGRPTTTSNVTPDEVGQIRRQSQTSGTPPVSPEGLAAAAKGLSFIKDASLPVAEGTAVMVEALRQGFRSHEMLDLGREVKRRERDYREGRASLQALREAIAGGRRPDQLFRDGRAGAIERPAARRAEPTVARPEPAARPERPQPAERPARPEPPTTERTR